MREYYLELVKIYQAELLNIAEQRRLLNSVRNNRLSRKGLRGRVLSQLRGSLRSSAGERAQDRSGQRAGRRSGRWLKTSSVCRTANPSARPVVKASVSRAAWKLPGTPVRNSRN